MIRPSISLYFRWEIYNAKAGNEKREAADMAIYLPLLFYRSFLRILDEGTGRT